MIVVPYKHSLDVKSLRGVPLCKYQAVYFFSGKSVAEAIGLVVMAARSSRDTLFTSSLLSFPYSSLQVHLDGKDCVLYPFVANTSRQAYPLALVS